MIIDIGTGVDESVVKWKYNDKDKWRDADIDELIHLYESIVYCKDCRYCTEYFDRDGYSYWECAEWDGGTDADGFCHYGERREDSEA